MQPPAQSARRRRAVEVGVAMLVGLLIFSVPLLLIDGGRARHPELRVVNVGGTLSTYITLDDARLLIVSVTDARDANALLGRIRRPWEPGPTALVASAAGSAASLLTTLDQTEPVQVIVLGLPGAAAEWTAIERICAERNIELSYVPQGGTGEHKQIQLAFDAGEHPAVVVRAQHVNVAIGLDGEFPMTQAAVVISNGDPPPATRATLLVRGKPLDLLPVGTTELLVDRDDSITLVLEPSRVAARGGLVRQAQDETSPATKVPIGEP